MVRTSRRRRWPARVAGVLGTAALLGSGAAIAVMVVPAPEDESVVPAAPAATAEPEDRAARKPRRPPLTRAQRRAREAAVATLTQQGYEPVRLADYVPGNELRVLLGVPGTDDAGPKRAFFFVGREFIGHDADAPSASLKLVRAGDRTVTLRYGIYAPGDRRCCPGDGFARIRFQWDGATLVPRGEIPPSWVRVPSE